MYKGELIFHTASKSQFSRNTSRRYISLEPEIARGSTAYVRRNVCAVYGDSIVRDGSVPSGWEVNTNPSQGDAYLDHISTLCAALRDGDAEVNSTCGLHCHIDARDYSYYDLFQLCRIYVRIEKALYSLVSKSRQDNTFCRPCSYVWSFKNYRTFKDDLIEKLYSWKPSQKHSIYDLKASFRPAHKHAHGSRNEMSERTTKYMDCRYRALNIHSWFYRGTIEFRHHQGSTKAATMQNWGMVCAAIVDAGATWTSHQIDEMPVDSFDALLSLMPSEELRQWCNQRRDYFASRR